jgi:hypothetical protein
MLVDNIQAELVRLQLHPVNLGVSAKSDGLVALEGSLLRYWTIPHLLDGQWFLTMLQGLPAAAGPEVVMNALCAAQAAVSAAPKTHKREPQLKLFDPAPRE